MRLRDTGKILLCMKCRVMTHPSVSGVCHLYIFPFKGSISLTERAVPYHFSRKTKMIALVSVLVSVLGKSSNHNMLEEVTSLDFIIIFEELNY